MLNEARLVARRLGRVVSTVRRPAPQTVAIRRLATKTPPIKTEETSTAEIFKVFRQIDDHVQTTVTKEVGRQLDGKLDKLATKEEVAGLRTEVHEFRAEMIGEIGGLRTEMIGKIGGLRTEVESRLNTFLITMVTGVAGFASFMFYEHNKTREQLAQTREDTREQIARIDKKLAILSVHLLGKDIEQLPAAAAKHLEGANPSPSPST